jgi:hypothetical protein
LELETNIVKKLLYIALYPALAALLLLLLAMAPVLAQTVVYQGQVTPLSVDQKSGDTYAWELYNDGTVDFAKVPGACPTNLADFVGGNTGATVSVEWKEPGIYFFKVTAFNITGCTMNLSVGIVKVLPSLPKAVIDIDPADICIGESAELKVTFSGKDPWSMKLQAKDKNGIVVTDYNGVSAFGNPLKIPINPKLTTKYTVIEVSNVYGVQTIPSNSVTLTVHPLPEKTPIYLKKP